MGGVTQAIAAAARTFGVEIRTAAPVAQITTSGGAVTGVLLECGEELPHRPSRPPRTRRSRSSGSWTAPSAGRLRQRHRALADPQRRREGEPRGRPAAGVHRQSRLRPRSARRHHRACRVARRLEAGFQDAVNGHASRRPFADICIPSFSTTRWHRPGTTSSRCSPSGCRTSGPPSRTASTSRRTPTRSWRGWRRLRPASHLGAAPAGHRSARDGDGVRPGRRQHLPR